MFSRAKANRPLLYTCFGSHWECSIKWAIIPWFQGLGRHLWCHNVSTSHSRNVTDHYCAQAKKKKRLPLNSQFSAKYCTPDNRIHVTMVALAILATGSRCPYLTEGLGFMWIKVLLQWNSTSVFTSCTYSTYHLELALGTFICHFISPCLVCHTS